MKDCALFRIDEFVKTGKRISEREEPREGAGA